MNRNGLKEELTQIADLFYQERNEEGMTMFLSKSAEIGQIPIFEEQIHPLFDALEQGDYILAADILQHEMAERLSF